MSAENPLPDGKLLADHLDIVLRNGGFGDVESGFSSGQEQDIKETIFRNVVKDRAITFLVHQFPCSPQAFATLRDEVTRLAIEFRHWKEGKRSRLPWKQREQEIIDAITMQVLADSANQEYEDQQKNLGNSLPGTGDYKFFQDRIAYWSKIQEITEAALDIG